jgi:hypothetical protein
MLGNRFFSHILERVPKEKHAVPQRILPPIKKQLNSFALFAYKKT